VEENDQVDKEYINTKCLEVKKMMWKCCTKTNSDYYQPFLMAKKAVEEENSKELVALSRKSQAFSEASRGVIEVVFMFTGRSQ